ncbi:nitroreductase [Acidipropionibacterium jensenii]|uniref:nitroreductase family protein n=1 Tax=Acidipropionibacterium jensenii TaxID=1749 RepID=UPI000BC30105|nr:nitroreductase family protein [Acidipropionibacterium jensenii]AZZ42565.1 nitroreductase [Acidipropionibacterium jensenii]
MTDITLLLRNRWSPRGYDPDHTLSAEDADLLLEAARWAPSAMNLQPWRFIMGLRGDPVRARVDRFVVGHSDWALDASALVVNICRSGEDHLEVAHYDLGDAVAHMCLQAEALGVHARQFISFDHQGLSQEFGITAPWTAFTMTAIGRPAAGLEPTGRQRVERSELVWPTD